VEATWKRSRSFIPRRRRRRKTRNFFSRWQRRLVSAAAAAAASTERVEMSGCGCGVWQLRRCPSVDRSNQKPVSGALLSSLIHNPLRLHGRLDLPVPSHGETRRNFNCNLSFFESDFITYRREVHRQTSRGCREPQAPAFHQIRVVQKLGKINPHF